MLLKTPPPGSGHLAWSQDEFTPTAGQITFIMSSIPVDVVSFEFYVNGVLYDEGADYVRSGATVTWQNPFVLKTTDQVIARYQ